MRLLSPLAGVGVCLRMKSGGNCVILTIVSGLGQPSMESMVSKSSQRSPVIQIIGSSFLLPVYGATTICTMPSPTATIGLRPSIRTVRTTRTTCASIQAASAGTTTSGTSANPSVPSQNNKKGGLAQHQAICLKHSDCYPCRGEYALIPSGSSRDACL